MMRIYAEVAGLPRRRVLPVPVLSPTLSSHWVGLVTPVPSGLARPLVESLRNTSVAREHDIAAYVSDPPEGLLGYRRAVELALTKIRDVDVPTRWSSASPSGAPSEPLPSDPDWAGGSLYVDEREREVHADPAALWRVIEGIGGENGWYSFPLGWQVRGLIDRLSGGPGLRRGRRDPRDVVVGDSVDFWRVEEVEEGRLLRLRAEMRLPGEAVLEFAIEPLCGRNDRVRLIQTARFLPRGVLGLAYWYAMLPLHNVVFGRLLRGIRAAAEAETLRTARASYTLIATEGSRSPRGPVGRQYGRPTATRPPADPPGSGSRPLVAEPSREGSSEGPPGTRRAP